MAKRNSRAASFKGSGAKRAARKAFALRGLGEISAAERGAQSALSDSAWGMASADALTAARRGREARYESSLAHEDDPDWDPANDPYCPRLEAPAPELEAALAATLPLFFERAREAQLAVALKPRFDPASVELDAAERALSQLILEASECGLFERALDQAGALLVQTPDFPTARFTALPAFLEACSREPGPLGAQAASRLFSLARAAPFWSAYAAGETALSNEMTQHVNMKNFWDRGNSLNDPFSDALALGFKRPAVAEALGALVDRIFETEQPAHRWPILWSAMAIPSHLRTLAPRPDQQSAFQAAPFEYWLSALSASYGFPELTSDPLVNWIIERCVEASARAAFEEPPCPWRAYALATQLATMCHKPGLQALELAVPGALESAGAQWGQARFEFNLNEGLYEMMESAKTERGAWALPAINAARLGVDPSQPDSSERMAGRVAQGMAALIQASLLSEATRSLAPAARKASPAL